MIKTINTKTKLDNIQNDNAKAIICEIIRFLQLFICITLAKRIICMMLIVLGMPNVQVAELTGVTERNVRDLRKAMGAGDIRRLLVVRGGGRKGKLKDIEDAIVDEIEANNYHSRQQIADMIHEKHGIKISVSAVGKLLKKKASNA
jgi:transposase